MEIEVTGSIKDVKQKMLLIRVIRPGIFTDISPPWARVIWTCIRGGWRVNHLLWRWLPRPPAPAASGWPGRWSDTWGRRIHPASARLAVAAK